MSLSPESPDPVASANSLTNPAERRKRKVLKRGVGLLAVASASVLFISAYAALRDRFDRVH